MEVLYSAQALPAQVFDAQNLYCQQRAAFFPSACTPHRRHRHARKYWVTIDSSESVPPDRR